MMLMVMLWELVESWKLTLDKEELGARRLGKKREAHG